MHGLSHCNIDVSVKLSLNEKFTMWWTNILRPSPFAPVTNTNKCVVCISGTDDERHKSCSFLCLTNRILLLIQ